MFQFAETVEPSAWDDEKQKLDLEVCTLRHISSSFKLLRDAIDQDLDARAGEISKRHLFIHHTRCAKHALLRGRKISASFPDSVVVLVAEVLYKPYISYSSSTALSPWAFEQATRASRRSSAEVHNRPKQELIAT
jgi:hypothetical protein